MCLSPILSSVVCGSRNTDQRALLPPFAFGSSYHGWIPSSSASHTTKDTRIRPTCGLGRFLAATEQEQCVTGCKGQSDAMPFQCLSSIMQVSDRPTYDTASHSVLPPREKWRRVWPVVGRECIQRNGPPVSDMG